MSSPYRHALAVLDERREEVARTLGETDAALAELTTERMRLRIELDALEHRLTLIRRRALDASAIDSPGDARQRHGMLVAAMVGSMALSAYVLFLCGSGP